MKKTFPGTRIQGQQTPRDLKITSKILRMSTGGVKELQIKFFIVEINDFQETLITNHSTSENSRIKSKLLIAEI